MGNCCVTKPTHRTRPSTHSSGAYSKADHATLEKIQSPTTDSTIQRNIRTDYDFGKILGHGQFGTVREAVKKETGVTFAVKTINKKRVEGNLHLLKREAEILLTLDHPNLIKAFESYEDDRSLHIVTELCTGGELLDRITEKSRYKEKGAAKVMRQILAAVNHLHLNGICHRDLKPENFLFVSREKGASLKLVDFGLASKFANQLGTEMKSVVGTPYYLAPELLNRGRYGPLCDMWSIGVIMYMLLSGTLPFEGSSAKEVYKNVQTNAPKFSKRFWRNISDEAKSLLTSLLSKVPTNRPTASQALGSNWFENCTFPSKSIGTDNIQQLKRYKADVNLRRKALYILVEFISVPDMNGLKVALEASDSTKSGGISLEALMVELKKRGFDEACGKIYKIMSTSGLDLGGTLRYSELIDEACAIKTSMVENSLIAQSPMVKAASFLSIQSKHSGVLPLSPMLKAFTISPSTVQKRNLRLSPLLSSYSINPSPKLTNP